MKQFSIGYLIVRVWFESGTDEFTLLNFGIRLFDPCISLFLVLCGLGIRIQIGGK